MAGNQKEWGMFLLVLCCPPLLIFAIPIVIGFLLQALAVVFLIVFGAVGHACQRFFNKIAGRE